MPPPAFEPAFQAPPRTTEQIIHPDMFLAGEGPKPLADPVADGPAVRSGSLGQLMLSLMLGFGIVSRLASGYISDRIAVLYLGRLMELGPAEVVFGGPHHPYTEALLSAVPTIDGGGRERIRLEGEIPSAADPPTGCVFHTRCHRFLGDICVEQEPPLVEAEPGHLMRCHIPIEELRRLQAEQKEPQETPA